MSEFKIGTTLVGMTELDTLIPMDGPADPDWSFQPFSRALELGNGQVQGQGFSIAKWRWNFISDTNRETLQDFVGTNLSATVYIRTAHSITTSGAIVFKSYQAIMRWPPVDEDFQADKVMGLILFFTHLVLQA